MEYNLESIKITVELLQSGARGRSELCKMVQGKYRLKRMWLFKTIRLLLILLPFALIAYYLVK